MIDIDGSDLFNFFKPSFNWLIWSRFCVVKLTLSNYWVPNIISVNNGH